MTFSNPTMNAGAKWKCSRRSVGLFAMMALLALLPTVKGASIIEPATTFYGRIWGAGSARPFPITAGTLDWTVRRASGTDLHLRAELFPLRDGDFSYRLDVPHEAFAIGLSEAQNSISLGATESMLEHWQIKVDGLEATILGPAGYTFNVAQVLRTATYRMDLVVPLEALDSDGDGIPDWWEELYGQDLATEDSDNDGRNNLAEYLAGLNPNHDDRLPSLVTKDIRAYAGATTMVSLRAADTDTASSGLVYQLISVPNDGVLKLRNAVGNPASPDQSLTVGDSFTQLDVEQGRVVYTEGGTGEYDRFQVTLSDGTESYVPVTNKVEITIYQPARPVEFPPLPDLSQAMAAGMQLVGESAAQELPWMLGYWMGENRNFIVGDLSWDLEPGALQTPSSHLSASDYASGYVPQFGEERSHFMLGGPSDDVVLGGMNDDVLIGGPGDDVLTGGAGEDLFAFFSSNDGHDRIVDFDLNGHDRIDVSRLLNGDSPFLPDYLRLTPVGGDTLIEIDADGEGATYQDVSILLSGVQLSADSLHELIETKVLLTGDKQMPPRITIASGVSIASENGPQAGSVVLTRSGSLAGSITVVLQITGSAVNGVDYEWIDSTVVLPSGLRTLDLSITPFVDGQTEQNEVVAVRVMAGTGYEVGVADRAQVTIEDLAPMITVEALETLAINATQQPAYLLFTRSGVVDRSVLVRLKLGGAAANGVDYASIPTFLNLAAGQTSLVLPVTLLPSAELPPQGDDLVVTVLPDSSYKLGARTTTAVMLVESRMDLAQWMASGFGGVSDSPETFAQGDYGNLGISNLKRYAFGLDPLDPTGTREALPRFEIIEGRLCVVFRRPAAIRDVEYLVETSTDLVDWQSGETVVEPFYPAEFAADVNVQAYRSRSSATESPIQFMQVRVRYQP